MLTLRWKNVWIWRDSLQIYLFSGAFSGEPLLVNVLSVKVFVFKAKLAIQVNLVWW